MWSVFTWACCWASESHSSNDEQLVRVGGAQVVIVALKAVLLLDLCQNAGSGDLLQKSVPLAGEHTVGDQKHHVFHGEISLIMFQCVFF